jgi:hypothetical protein
VEVVILALWPVVEVEGEQARWEQHHEGSWGEDGVATVGLLLEAEGEVVQREQDCGLEEQEGQRPSVLHGKEEEVQIWEEHHPTALSAVEEGEEAQGSSWMKRAVVQAV